MIINRANMQLLFTGFKASFQQGFGGLTPDYNPFVLRVPSSTSKEVYPWLGKTTGFREWVGDRVLQNLKLHDYTIKNKSFENTVTVDRDSIEDDTYGVFNPMMSQMGQDAAEHPGLLVYDMLANGFSRTCYDGQYFFDTDHPVTNSAGAEVSVSNFQGGSGTPWFLMDTGRVMKPLILQERKGYNFVALDRETDDNVFMRKEFVYGVDCRLNVGYGLWQLAYASRQDLTSDNFDAAFAAMQSMAGDKGRKLGIRPKLLVVPPTLRKKALEIVNAEQVNGTTNVNRNAVDVLVTPWL
ncbi:TPA: Mu-like prophage major head subunit gpT family protein [Pseudomonas aeruginosa]|nr:Mu-like prophage major head subunit gpT family protein [Pseudomonas aeruginosa]